MILFKKTNQLRQQLSAAKAANKKIGFVPTMGALHRGHLSLIETCKSICDVTVCSIFVNPAQFNDKSDYEKYPITIENDILLLENSGADILFLPAVAEVYPEGWQQQAIYTLGYLDSILEGEYRPGHFQGVCKVMHKLLNILQADILFLGQKDYQQCMVIKRMMDDLQLQTQLHIVPTQRELNGLAMSSRNMRLSSDAKEKAAAIYKALSYIKNNIHSASIEVLKTEAKNIISTAGFNKIDYVEICDAISLQPVHETNNEKLAALAAAFIEGVRLIDNVQIE